jgi:hypothetical protein
MKITYKMIMESNPCYDPKEIGMPEDYEATPLEFIREYRSKVRRSNDIIRVVTRPDVISKRILQEFALFCGNQVRHLMKDERSVRALDITRAYLDGQATREELKMATAAAYAAYIAARAAAAAAVAYAAAAVAYAAADDAAAAVAYAAAYAARAVSYASIPEPEARNQQIGKIIELLEGSK